MSVSLSLKLAEFPQNETIFDQILIAEFLVKIAAIVNISTGQLISELVTSVSELFTRTSKLVTHAIFVGPAPFSLDPRHFY
jgi:arginine exporter protein ArgO